MNANGSKSERLMVNVNEVVLKLLEAVQSGKYSASDRI